LAQLRLRNLSLWECTGISDFTPLSALADLYFLDLEGTTINDLAPISGLWKLRILWLKDCPNITDLRPLARLRSLQDVYIEGIPAGIDLAPLASINATVHIDTGQQVRNRKLLGRRVNEA
jgi:hypothetical protein